MEHNLIVVTSYPVRGSVHSAETVGVASYTKQLLTGISYLSNKPKIKVFAEKFGLSESYSEDKISIERVWKRGNIWDILKLWIRLLQASENVILVSFEAYMFGSLAKSFLSLFLFSTLKIFGKRVDVIMHQVPGRVEFLTGFNRSIVRVGTKVLGMLLNQFDSVVVFEEVLKKRVGKNGFFVPHLVPSCNNKDRKIARAKLGLDKNKYIAIYFGYISPYKGLERLIELWENEIGELVIAGGINPNHKNNPEMKEYVSMVMKKADEKQIKVTGFVPEELIELYFSACDLVILPYREMMSSSGPMSLAWAYTKPVIMTSNLHDYIHSPDIANGMKRSGLEMQDIYYKDSDQSLNVVVKGVHEKVDNFEKWAIFMQSVRSLKNVSLMMSKILWRTDK